MSWMNENRRFTIQDGIDVDFDQAYVLNGLHITSSAYDPNQENGSLENVSQRKTPDVHILVLLVPVAILVEQPQLAIAAGFVKLIRLKHT
ncbi:hypothetical protein PENANT_c027G10846 [Penicillium antarcticum]|uniref:Uncharacterized protein n=1 Tax=Penicillium antarcticum TaxID=416450 RepID=A0A1V6PXD4_9EURO|nr:hypothetical protein PENANT_c027G10846 [Penicillium antarcticum]